MRTVPRLIVLVMLLATSGCAPIIAGSLIQADATNNARHESFINSFNQVNATREAAGLLPLDFCSEAYWHDRGWARQRSECADRILDYEKGLTAILNPPGVARSRATMDSLALLQRAYLDSLIHVRDASKKH